MPPVPFTIDVPDAALENLQNWLSATRWPRSIDDESQDDGASLAFMRGLADHWLNRFGWRLQERLLNRLPQFMATIDDQDIHFVHRHGVGPSPIPIVIRHGWPGSFVEMEPLIPLLADPDAHGGDPADAFHVVVPLLPGYGFSPAPTRGASGRGKSLCCGASSWPSSDVRCWRSDRGKRISMKAGFVLASVRVTYVVLACAHLDHDPGNSAPSNLKALCQRCHMIHDAAEHRWQRWWNVFRLRAIRDLYEDPRVTRERIAGR